MKPVFILFAAWVGFLTTPMASLAENAVNLAGKAANAIGLIRAGVAEVTLEVVSLGE